jgi:hypothetical protein
MIIDKTRVDNSLRKIRGLYRNHSECELTPSSFVTKARAELNALYMQHTRELIEATADHVIKELRCFQAQFALNLDFYLHLTQVTRGYRGIRASLCVSNKEYTYHSGAVEIFVGPFDEWNRIAVHTTDEQEAGICPSFYTKRKRKRWQEIQDFNFPDLLQKIKEDIERPEPEYDDEDDIPF